MSSQHHDALAERLQQTDMARGAPYPQQPGFDPSPAPEIFVALDNLENAVALVVEAADRLTNRIDPVLRPSTPSISEKLSPDQPSTGVAVADTVAALADRLGGVRRVLVDADMRIAL